MSSKQTPNLPSWLTRFAWGKWSLAYRLTAWYTIASFALIVGVTTVLYLALSRNLIRDNELFLADKVHVISAILHDRPHDWDALREEIELESSARRYQPFYIRLLDERGQPLLTTPGMDTQVDQVSLTRWNLRQHGVSFPFRNRQGRLFRATVTKISVALSPRRIWSIQVAVDLTQPEMLLTQYRLYVWVMLVVAGLLCPWVGYRIAQRGIRPVQDVVEAARHISSTTLGERIQTEGYPVELATLANTFNEMLDRLQNSFRRLSQFSADIAHELRTPVNNIRGEAEVALARARSVEDYRDVLSSCLEESVRLSDLIGSLLFLARAESPGAHLRRECVSVRHVFQTVCDYYEAAAIEAGVSLSIECDSILQTEWDRSLVQRALGNLVSNAVKHTPRGGTISLSASRHANRLEVTVTDTGVGIPSEALSSVFDRFYRVDSARSAATGGTGLGLAIVRSIIALHGGAVSINSAVGRGTTLRLLFPAIKNSEPTYEPSEHMKKS